MESSTKISFSNAGGRKILHEIAPEEPDVNSFQLAGRSKREASAQQYEPAPDIPGVTCSQGRKKREAQSGERRYEIAYAPAPDIDLPPCSGGGGGGGSGRCYTEKGRVCTYVN